MATIVFDLDGTLVDSLADIHAAINTALILEGAAPLSRTQARSFIGHGIPHLVAEAAKARDLPRAALPRLEAEMIRAYMDISQPQTTIFAGVIPVLAALQAQGHDLALCTNKAMAPTRRLLAQLDLARFFPHVIGGDSLSSRKPAPAMLHAALAPFGGQGLFVGDSEVDAQTAVNAAQPFALFTQGYRKAAPEALPHSFRFDDWCEFLPRAAAYL